MTDGSTNTSRTASPDMVRVFSGAFALVSESIPGPVPNNSSRVHHQAANLEGDLVFNPFSGRGMTTIKVALHERELIANDTNPILAI